MTNNLQLICFNGPESTGKSVMAKKMAAHFNTEYVPEVAREMITSNAFTVDDIIRIGKAQSDRVLQKLKTADRYLFCDSDLITTQIYSSYYLNEVPAILSELEKQITYDHYFLFDIDVPWMDDGLRDLGNDNLRQRMFDTFTSEIEKRNIPYTLVKGNWSEREAIILNQLNEQSGR
jgi:HTH-type transcriptional repressor of NAD biosynthesis genes